jgi:beta-galactosidase
MIKAAQAGGQSLLADGPYLQLRWRREQPAVNGNEFAETDPSSWTLEKMDWLKRDGGIQVELSGRTEGLRTLMSYFLSPDRVVSTRFDLLDIPPGVPAEIGIAFELEDGSGMEWRRKGLWSTYPDDHIGRPSGRALLGGSTITTYRQEPPGGWAMDVWDYFLQGLERPEDTSALLPNDARSLKEHIFQYSLGFKDSRGRVTVEAAADQAVRLKSVDGGRIRLIILTNWDYPDLGWGNLTRPFKFEENRAGRISVCLE